MKKQVLILLLFLSSLVQAQNTALFEEANEAYANNDFETAVSKYEKILENGETSVAVYYNLGNAYYKLNNVAPSIYYFEKALQLDPTDEDVQNNIEFARSMTIDDIPVIEETGFQKTINSFISTFSYNTWAFIAIALSVIFVVLFLLYYFSRTSLQKRIFFGLAMFVFVLGGMSVFFAFQQQEIQFNNQFAIIFADEVPVRNEPSQRGDAAFSLHAGTKTKVLEDYQGWFKIELSNGTQGWIEGDYLKQL